MFKRSVFCTAIGELQAAVIVGRLKGAGFSNNDISALFPDTSGTRDFACEKGAKVPEGASPGAGTGAILAGTFGLLAGIGALAIPGAGPLKAAGPIAAELSAAAIGGGISQALIGMGIPEYEARRYEGKVMEGWIFISVLIGDAEEAKLAEDIFKEEEAQDITSAGETAGRWAAWSNELHALS